MTNIATSSACGLESSIFSIGRGPFVSISESTGVIQTPLYTAIIQEGTISTETEAKIAEEIIRIHTTVMTVPKNLVRIPSALLSHGRFLQVEGLLQNMDNDISLKAFDVMPLAQSMTWKFDRTIFTEIWQGLS